MLSWSNVYYVILPSYISMSCYHLLISTKNKVRLMGMSLDLHVSTRPSFYEDHEGSNKISGLAIQSWLRYFMLD